MKMNNNELESPLYFSAGDIVTIKHDVPNRPIGWIVEKVTRTVKNTETNNYDTIFLGMRVRWFDKNGALQEAVISTKDLQLI